MELFETLQQLNISYKAVDHEPAYTADQADHLQMALTGEGCKSLFLTDAHERVFVLACLPSEKKADLKHIAKVMGTTRLHFVEPELLKARLNLVQGAVGPMGLINDVGHEVLVYIDAELAGRQLRMPANRTSRTIGLAYGDVLKFVKALGNRVVVDDLSFDPNKKVFITGAAGFIGYHLSKHILAMGGLVAGLDNLNAYYDVQLKRDRLAQLQLYPGFTFTEGDLADQATVEKVFTDFQPDIVVNLAAQDGACYTMDHPGECLNSNVMGFFNILEACRHHKVEHLLFASSSSVYGNRQKAPFGTTDNVDQPISLYAATKKFDELMAYTYSHLYRIPATGLRFFTVYGPFGRPDMAYFKFTNKIMKREPISIFNHGVMYRDFTYVDDIVEGIMHMLCVPPENNKLGAPYKIYNMGSNKPEKLMVFIETLEKVLGKEAKKEFLPGQPGDAYQTCADVSELEKDFGFKPAMTIEKGLQKFVDWYKGYYKV